MNLFRALFFTLFALASAHASAAVVYVTDGGGLLTGATGVVVDGVTYDVTFQDGTCIGLFPACDASTVFEFNTAGAAHLASQALSAQVFTTTTTEGAIFTGTPGLTAGCDAGDCYFYTPYAASATTAAVSAFVNQNSAGTDFTIASTPFGSGLSTGAGGGGFQVFAVWSTAASSVPAPATLSLLFAGFAALSGSAVRRSQRTARASS